MLPASGGIFPWHFRSVRQNEQQWAERAGQVLSHIKIRKCSRAEAMLHRQNIMTLYVKTSCLFLLPQAWSSKA